jgi:glutamate-5-semialdehyde dehydrogenase
MSAEQLVGDICQSAKQAARKLAVAGTDLKNTVLNDLALAVEQNAASLQSENAKDVEAGKEAGLSSAMIDRLTLSDKVIASMAAGLREVAALPDPVGEISSMQKRPNGLMVGKARIPLGVIGFIYESRPNVTVDAAALCLKSGNTVVLKGGKEAINSNLALAGLISGCLEKNGLPIEAVQVIPSTDRQATAALLRQEELVDVIIPRGGEGLIRFVAQNSSIPVLKHYKGVCHLYVDQGADHVMAAKICINSKVQRPGCAIPWRPFWCIWMRPRPFYLAWLQPFRPRAWRCADVSAPAGFCPRPGRLWKKTGPPSIWI